MFLGKLIYDIAFMASFHRLDPYYLQLIYVVRDDTGSEHIIQITGIIGVMKSKSKDSLVGFQFSKSKSKYVVINMERAQMDGSV